MNVTHSGAELIAHERGRQIHIEGYTADHDEHHGADVLTDAAVAYLNRDTAWWPWELRYFKPTPDDRVRELVKAGALIAAAIDALQAAEADHAE